MHLLRPLAVGLLTAALFTACKPAPPAENKVATSTLGQTAEQAAKAFDALLDAQWQHQLKQAPEFASTIGDKRYNDRWSDYSLQAVPAERRAVAGLLRQFEAVDAAALDEQRQLSLQMMLGQLRDTLDGIDLKTYEMPLDPMQGIHLTLAGYSDSFPFDTAKDYQDYIKRLQTLPAVVDRVIDVSRQGAKDGLMPPRYLLERVPEQIDGIVAQRGAQNPFASPLEKLDGVVPADQRDALRKQLLEAIDQQVRPAYAKLSAFVRNEYAPQGRTQEGLWSLPDGEKLYQYLVRTQTTTDLTPEQIHQIGLQEVARIEAEMTVIAKAQGYADLASFRKAVAADKRRFATSSEQLLEQYRHYVAGMQRELPKLFEQVPKKPLEVEPMPAFQGKYPPARYLQSNPESSKPGVLRVNISDVAHRTLINVETIAYHEGVPGHHLQVSLAQTLPLPPFRQQGGYNAYGEGWALYAERLGKDVGLYKDPYSDYGRLSADLLRANRLVLDTGVHYKRWNRQQMVDFFHAHPSDDEASMQFEIDRYIVWPGQSLGYKVGQLQFMALRAEAQKELGDRFDLRAFHTAVLGDGDMPLVMLQQHVRQWIAKVKAHQVAK
ncbi:DUF885 family protein [Xanthomonas sp. WHRI 8391]|uniref:DUF885 domain-containing protein n=1 Tax=Xanthomonas TaxID=338 RepID=UPI001A2F5729|nr:DUF885 family protein [Xanthomonas hortorum]MBG3851030.1 DUF885 family protein [Xanthomonas hortorum pv. carotae]UTS71457.1 DUF885 family protein [Xanthomonas hortorum]